MYYVMYAYILTNTLPITLENYRGMQLFTLLKEKHTNKHKKTID